MSNRPDIELALDVRSYERIIVVSSGEGSYPEHWLRPKSPAGISEAFRDADGVVIVDRIDINRRTISVIGEHRPRVLAMAPDGVEQEKSMRRMLSVAYPWSDVWTIYTSFGKLLVTTDVKGPAYDRDELVDMRSSLGVI